MLIGEPRVLENLQDLPAGAIRRSVTFTPLGWRFPGAETTIKVLSVSDSIMEQTFFDFVEFQL